jgi:acyl carrier protein
VSRIDQVREFVVNNFLFGDGDRLTDEEMSFLENGIIDSTGMLEVITFLEETFEIKIEDSELLPENLDSLKNIDQFVEKKLGSS